jgi:exonuclease SbcC
VRPLVVSMQAFGPYAGVQTLDFADLRGAGFFLITGPTGAGKTTVLDAMSFALYGDTSGGAESEGGRSGAAMRSDHADPGTLTRVVFDFSIGADLYRVERLPEQERPKLRGEGTTTHPQEATMWRLRRDDDGALSIDGAPLATGWTKVKAKAEDVLGFRGEQFRQVVMLPQGRFQQLIEADSNEREQILRALFDTGHYAAIELALKDEAATLRRAAEKVMTQRDEVLRQAESPSADDLRERCARLSVEAQDAAQHADEAEAADKASQKLLAEGHDAATRLREHAAAAAQIVELAARDAEIELLRAELDAAQRAAEVADVAREAGDAEAGLSIARDAAETTSSEAAAAAAALAAAAAALELQVSRAAAREHAAAEVTRFEAFVAGAGELANAREALVTATAEASARRREAEAADASWTAARALLAGLEAAWRDAQAGLLARSLGDGLPCPVCGSTEHPSPAELTADAPAEDDVDAARAAVESALERRDTARASLQRAEAALAGAEALAGERAAGLPPELADPDVLEKALGEARRVERELRVAFEHAQTSAHEAEIAATGSEAGRGAAGRARAGADTRAREAGARLAERLAQAGFSGEAERQNAHRDPSAIDQLEKLVSGHEQSALKAAERLRLAEQAAQGFEPPDLTRLETEAEACVATARNAREAAIGLRAGAEAAEKLLTRLDELAAEAAGFEARYAVVGRLADVANRRNARGLSFQSYVLGAFLDDVLVAASERLRTMSKSRYLLERTEERSGRKLAAGLGLLVYDAWTGVARPVTTLSGGEKFMAALSLALGLAEVVQAHAGGIRLETVFVDEGFGSLDDESLDLAISSLMSLNEGGRLVGIVSHVSELRERIDARLEVSAGTSGSSARFVVP